MHCAAYGGLAYEKLQSALRAFVQFFSGTFGAGVNAYALPYYPPQTSHTTGTLCAMPF
jgi:hypothetical protein